MGRQECSSTRESTSSSVTSYVVINVTLLLKASKSPGLRDPPHNEGVKSMLDNMTNAKRRRSAVAPFALLTAISAVYLLVMDEFEYGDVGISPSNRRQLDAYEDGLDEINDELTLPTCVTDSRCSYHEAYGRFNDQWHWEHHLGSDLCPMTDYVSLLLTHTERSKRANGNDEEPERISLLLVGDSLDRGMLEHFCALGKSHNFTLTYPQMTNPDETKRNKSRYPDKSAAICSDGYVTVSYFLIFGMDRGCDNGPTMRWFEDREPYNTADRVREILPLDIRHASEEHPVQAIMASSSLWDLSLGCNNRADMDPEYLASYESGAVKLRKSIVDVSQSMQGSEGAPLPRIYWRTSPPVSLSYSRKSVSSQGGRNRENQAALNDALRTVVESKMSEDRVMDWSNMIMGGPHPLEERQISPVLPDGRHYTQRPSLSFFNLWLNEVFSGVGNDEEILTPRLCTNA